MPFYRELGYMGPRGFRRNIFCVNDNLSKEIKQLQNVNDNTDLYYSIFQSKDSTKFNKEILSPLYFDIDGEYSLNGLEQTKLAAISLYLYLTDEMKLRKEEIQFYFSGAKGFHVIVPDVVLDLKPESALNLKIKHWVQQIIKHVENHNAFDLKIYDARRLFRIPNTINSKTGLYKIPVTIDEIRTFNLPGLQALAAAPRNIIDIHKTDLQTNEAAVKAFKSLPTEQITVRSTGRVQITNQKLPPCIECIMAQSVNKGNRNNIAIMLASALIQHSFSWEQALEYLSSWNENNNPPMEFKELSAACHSAERMTRAGRGYGCSSIRSTGFISSNLCRESCDIFKLQQNKIGPRQKGESYLGF